MMKFKAIKAGKNVKVLNRVAYYAHIETYEDGQPLDIEVSKPKKPRNNSQNRLMWAMFEEIDKLMHNDNRDLTKWQVLIEIGHYDEYEINGRLEKLPRRTSKLTTKEFGELCDKIIRFGVREFGVDLTPPCGKGYE